MIQVNLLPGGRKRAAGGRRLSLSLPKLGNLPQDRWVVGAVGAVILGVFIAGYLFLSLRTQRQEVEFALDTALQDSAVYSELVTRTTALLAARDSIINRVGVIQELERSRLVWPHVLDEIARSLPDYTWLTEVRQLAGGPNPQVRLVGQAGTIQAITVFIQQLEGSPFLRAVNFVSSSQALVEDQLVQNFELDLVYEPPPLEMLETEPLLDSPGSATAPPPGL